MIALIIRLKRDVILKDDFFKYICKNMAFSLIGKVKTLKYEFQKRHFLNKYRYIKKKNKFFTICLYL